MTEFNGAWDASLDRDIEAFYEEDEEECYNCGMVITRNHRRAEGCLFCAPDPGEEADADPEVEE